MSSIAAITSMDKDFLEDMHMALVREERLQATWMLPPTSAYAPCRQTVVVWVIEVCEGIASNPNVVGFQACYLLDRLFFLRKELDQVSYRGNFQLLAMACIWIAMKFAEGEDGSDLGQHLVHYADDAYSLQALGAAEEAVLRWLDWKVNAVTPNCLLTLYMSQLQPMHPDVHRFTIILLGLALQQHSFLVYAPSMLAAAALQCAGHLVHINGAFDSYASETWKVQVVTVTKRTLWDVSPCAHSLYEAYRRFVADHESLASDCGPTTTPVDKCLDNVLDDEMTPSSCDTSVGAVSQPTDSEGLDHSILG